MIIGTTEEADKLVGRYFIGGENNIFQFIKIENNLYRAKVIQHINRCYMGQSFPIHIRSQWYVALIESCDEKKILKSFMDKKKHEFDLEPNKIFL